MFIGFIISQKWFALVHFVHAFRMIKKDKKAITFVTGMVFFIPHK